MTLIDKIVHMFLLLIGPVLDLVCLSSNVEKSDPFLRYIHPWPFDPYGHRDY